MKKYLLATILFLLVLTWCWQNSNPNPTSTPNSYNTWNIPQVTVTTWEVSYFTDALWKGYSWYFVTPNTDWVFPWLILIHEWWWLNDNIKNLANEFAKQWYVVLAVDLYWMPATTDQNEAMKRASDIRNNLSWWFANLSAAVDYLKKLPQVDWNKLWSIWRCFWWGWAYEMAKNDLGTKVSVMYYGRFNTGDDLSHMRSEILGHFWEQDRSITIDSVREFQTKLKTLSWDHAIYIYPNAWHSFANEGAAYNEEAAKLAWDRTIEFLKNNLK